MVLDCATPSANSLTVECFREKAMATHASTLAWKIPWTEEPGSEVSDFTFTFHFHALEKEMATHSSVLARRIPGMAEPGGLPFMGLQSPTRLKRLSSSSSSSSRMFQNNSMKTHSLVDLQIYMLSTRTFLVAQTVKNSPAV